MRLRKGWTRALVYRAFQEGATVRWLIYDAVEGLAGKRFNIRTYQQAFAHIERIIRRESRRTGR